MKIYIIISILFINLFLINNAFGEEGGKSCKYESQINECNEANKTGSARGITEFICLESEYKKPGDIISGTVSYRNQEEIVYQIVLDEKFKEVDEDIDKYLSDLEKQKDKFFQPGGEKTYVDGINEVEQNFAKYGEFYNKFKILCDGEILLDAMACMGGEASNQKGDLYLKSDGGACMGLAETKLNISREVAYNILLLNKAQVERDTKKKLVQKQRKKYDGLVNIMNINLGYLERIWQKWQFKIKNPLK